MLKLYFVLREMSVIKTFMGIKLLNINRSSLLIMNNMWT